MRDVADLVPESVSERYKYLCDKRALTASGITFLWNIDSRETTNCISNRHAFDSRDPSYRGMLETESASKEVAEEEVP